MSLGCFATCAPLVRVRQVVRQMTTTGAPNTVRRLSSSSSFYTPPKRSALQLVLSRCSTH